MNKTIRRLSNFLYKSKTSLFDSINDFLFHQKHEETFNDIVEMTTMSVAREEPNTVMLAYKKGVAENSLKRKNHKKFVAKIVDNTLIFTKKKTIVEIDLSRVTIREQNSPKFDNGAFEIICTNTRKRNENCGIVTFNIWCHDEKSKINWKKRLEVATREAFILYVQNFDRSRNSHI